MGFATGPKTGKSPQRLRAATFTSPSLRFLNCKMKMLFSASVYLFGLIFYIRPPPSLHPSPKHTHSASQSRPMELLVDPSGVSASVLHQMPICSFSQRTHLHAAKLNATFSAELNTPSSGLPLFCVHYSKTLYLYLCLFLSPSNLELPRDQGN